MSSFFNMDNPFFRFMGRMSDLIILNLICIVCCIPIVTIGPALTALFYMTLKMVRDEESYIVRGFFHSFRQNLRQGIIINLIMLAAGIVLWLDLQIVQSGIGGSLGNIMLVTLGVLAIIYLMVFLYIYPVLARFYNTIRNTFVNALLMSIRHLPYTAVMLIISVFPVIIFFLPESQITLQSALLLLLFLIGISGVAFCNSFFLVKIFDQYAPAEEEEAGPSADAEDTAAEAGLPGGISPYTPLELTKDLSGEEKEASAGIPEQEDTAAGERGEAEE